MRKSSLPAAVDGGRGIAARRIVAAIADAALRWSDADFPPRMRATRAIVERTGYPEPVVEYALDRLFEQLTGDVLNAAIDGELGAVDALDGFVPRSGRPDAYARGVGRVVVVASDTTIGVALPPALYALCAHCQVLVRDRADGLIGAFSATLAEESALLASRLEALPPVPHDDPAWLAHLARARTVVAFGGSDALRALRERTDPQARFVAFGHRTSVTYIAREALADIEATLQLAHGIARDALLYDGEGCLSSHAVFVERTNATSFDRFVDRLAKALDRDAVEFPASVAMVPSEVTAYRRSAEFRATQGGGRVVGSSTHLLVIEPPRDEPPPLLPRTLAVYAVDSPAEFARFVASHALALEAVAVAPFPVRDDLVATVVESGAARIARIGALQAPSLGAEHGGVARITPFVRWITRDP